MQTLHVQFLATLNESRLADAANLRMVLPFAVRLKEI